MIYNKCRINTTAQILDKLIAALSAKGFDQIEVESALEFNYHLKNRQPWELADGEFQNSLDQNAVTVYTSDETQTKRLRECVDALDDCELNIKQVNEDNWANAWQQYYKPIDIGHRLRIQPAWLEVSGECKRAIFYNNPGMSFGTGTHASTLLCLELIERTIKGGERVLDIGCGSGILFISSMLLGASKTYAIDIDPTACNIARENTVINGVEQHCNIVQADFTSNFAILQEMIDFSADIICANLVADLLVELSQYIKKLLKPGALLIASGILDEHADRVIKAFDIEIVYKLECDGWVTLGLR